MQNSRNKTQKRRGDKRSGSGVELTQPNQNSSKSFISKV